MRGRVRGLGNAEAEALVRERLRSIMAAATPQLGWVPDRVAASTARIAPAAPDQSRASPDAVPDAEPLEPCDSPVSIPVAQREAEKAASPQGRHRGSAAWARRLRWDPGRPGALALCVVAVLAALLSAGLTWWSRPTSSTGDEVSARPLAAGVQATGEPGQDDSDRQAGTTTATETEPGSGSALVVSVIGQVRQPGLVTVTSGARVADAIAAAGGALPEADLTSVNLARLVVDGEQIAVGVPGSALPGGADPAQSGGLVNLNTAGLAELEELPGIGPVLAQRIVDFRVDNGGFSSVEQLREVSGVGPTVYEDIADLVTV